MFDPKLDVAFWDYDRTRALANGTVKIEDAHVTFHSAPIVTQIFEGVVNGNFNVSELGMTYFLRTFKDNQSPFVAIPVFPNRCFRHSAIYINKASGITKPEDLNGKKIGELALYSHDAGSIPKGILMDEYGFKPESCEWIIGGLDWPMKPIDFVPDTHPANVKVSNIEEGKELGAMLESGEIDALFSADNPKCILEHSPKITRLFEDYPAVEREYYKRTGIFPIMHTVVIRKDLLAKHPDLAKNVYQGFCDAKAAAVKEYEHGYIFNNMGTMFPWFGYLYDQDQEVLGKDWWPYGMAANRKAVEVILRYHYEQGITDRLFKIEDIFVPELLTT
jgi:ABC-type nitrate/sulfonate/bicarbonate transport system substrate-binding protein